MQPLSSPPRSALNPSMPLTQSNELDRTPPLEPSEPAIFPHEEGKEAINDSSLPNALETIHQVGQGAASGPLKRKARHLTGDLDDLDESSHRDNSPERKKVLVATAYRWTDLPSEGNKAESLKVKIESLENQDSKIYEITPAPSQELQKQMIARQLLKIHFLEEPTTVNVSNQPFSITPQ